MIRNTTRLLLVTAAFLAACVTINVYFPAAAAEAAADRIIHDVWGPGGQPRATGEETTGWRRGPGLAEAVRLAALDVSAFLVPAAHAQVDLDIETPQIRALTASMATRHRQLKPYYASGAVGLTSDAMIEVRDRNAVPLAERNTLRQLVEEENRDRRQLYQAIAQANNHPEWEDEIRKTFAERWISNAQSGWYYRTPGGEWRQK